MHTRKILHLDLDAFFCAVEELRDPSLRGKPFAVGGRPEQRGVVASCSYAARAQGVRSAMPMGRALRLCPELLIIPARHANYGEVSRKVMARLHALTPLVEQISIDEAYLDVTDLPGDGEVIARTLQATIRSELGLPCSLGIATNKLVAKVANNMGKAANRGSSPPNAITVVPPGQEAAYLGPLPCSELWGVGPRTAERLREMGIETIGQIARTPEAELVRRFGKNGAELWLHARGLDESPIVTQHERKSVSQETTFVRDVSDGDLLRKTLFDQARDVSATLQRKQLVGSTVKLKLRWANFTTVTRQTTLAEPTAAVQPIFQAAAHLLQDVWDGKPVRLIGVGLSKLTSGARQATLFDAPNEKEEKLQEALRDLRARFGEGAVKRAGDLGDDDEEQTA